jgi:hypothetical protein
VAAPGENDHRPNAKSTLLHPPPHCLGLHLFSQAVKALAHGHKSALADDRPSALSFSTVIEPKTVAAVNPVPAFGFLV